MLFSLLRPSGASVAPIPIDHELAAGVIQLRAFKGIKFALTCGFAKQFEVVVM